MSDPSPNFSVEPNENNMAIWTVTINGPVSSGKLVPLASVLLD